MSLVNRAKEIKETERQISQIELQLLRTSEIVSQYDGTVLEIPAKPGQELSSGIGIVTISAQQSDDKLVNVSFLPVSEGKKIKPGMDLQITPSTVKREEYGGIKAKVAEVSKYPVTKQGAVSIIGNPDILPSVINEGPHVAVFTQLETDNSTNSGYKWSSSKGPELQITPGTTTTVRVKIEEKKPIEFVLPIFKDWTGIS
ncbi:MAG: NHLP bacteriocin system secretion protein [Cyanobacteria bacterium J06643_5]